MKCRSCGKRFDYEKYYGICPKCGVYHKPEEKAEEQPETSYSQQEMFYEQPEISNSQPEMSYKKPQFAIKPFRSTIVLGIIVLVVFVSIVGVGVAGYFLTDYVENTTRLEVESRILGKKEPVESSFGDDLSCNVDQISVNVEKMEVVAQANQVDGFPQDEVLIGVRVVKDNRGAELWSDSYYDAMDAVPVDFYLQYDGRYRSCVDPYCFDPDYMHVLNGRKDYSGYGSYDAGYLYFFVPQDAQECAVYVQVWDEAKENIQACYRIPFSLNTEEDGGVQDE